MNHRKNLLVPSLAAPLLLALGSVAEAPSFAPEEGTVLTKTVKTTTDITLDEMSIVMAGNEMPGGMEMSTNSVQTVKVTDTYAAVGGGRPTKLERTYDELGSTATIAMSHPMMGDQSQDVSGSSELEGLGVVFTWDADAEEYDVAFDEDSEGEDELLEDLYEDLDLRGLLPEDELEEGESWSIDPDEMRYVLAPGGSLKVEPEEDMSSMGMGSSSPPSLNEALGELEGELEGTFDGYRDADGVRCAVISLAIDLSSANDMSEYMAEAMANQELPEGMELDMEVQSFDMEFLFEGTGELLWNMETGLVHSLDVSCDFEQIIDASISMNMGEQSADIEQSMSMSGSLRVELTTEG